HIYPVPDINNPFLGVHFTKTFDRYVKVGPTAIPSFWRENYKGLWRFNLKEFLETFFLEGKLFLTNSFNFRKIALEEIKKYSLKYLINKASALVNEIDSSKFGSYLPSGIRAQLFDKKKRTLEMDFVIEKSDDSVHILNAVSPAFTCAFSFSRFVVDMIKDELVKRIK
ncbi:MAG: L-2-hydroxyglutarate oxidase, partial [Candidatus Schekmanbacteria bacterium]